MARQLLGHSTAAAYTHVLSHGARCVEIDVWPSAKGPIVTHGHTFSKSVPFLDVCKAIGASAAINDWPVLVSLECHVGVEGQPEIIDFMDRTWGDKLVREVLHGTTPERVSPQELKGKILLLVCLSLMYMTSLAESVDLGGILPHSGTRRRFCGYIHRFLHRFRIIARME